MQIRVKQAGGLLLRVSMSLVATTAIGCSEKIVTPQSNTTARDTTATASESVTAPHRAGSGGLKFEKRKTQPLTAANFSNISPRLIDVAERSGLSHTYLNGASGRLLMVEATGGGGGWIDFDRDGNWDLYLNQGGDPAAAVPASRPPHQLFRNMGQGRFELVTPAALIDEHGYGQGVAVGDFDNDGFDDIYVANVGGNSLYRNCGDGTFLNATAVAGVRGGLWSTSAAWGDIDLDGDLDLYVCNYADFDPYHPRLCHNSEGRIAICHPNVMDPVPDDCYLNLGDGTFRAVASERGLFGPGNLGLGVAIADFDNDGWPDIFVANDTHPNFLFINDGRAHFQESAAILGCAVNTNGNPQANMGIAVGDYDRNGWLDVYVTHFTQEWNTLYRNRGPEGFQDVSGMVGLVPPELDKLGFGTIMADLDYDGFDELFVANGHINDLRDQGYEYAMNCQLYSWQGRRWHEHTAQAGEFFERKLIGRAVATADYDNDGDLDLVVVPQGSPVALLNNQSRLGNWLKLEFVGRKSNRRAIGTRVTVRIGERSIMQELAGGTSYCAAHQPALFFGLGDWSGSVDLEIRWPCGTVETRRQVSINQPLVLLEPVESQP
jgi:hypothetical protein